MELHPINKILYIKGRNDQSEDTTYRMGKIIPSYLSNMCLIQKIQRTQKLEKKEQITKLMNGEMNLHF
jgi:hypothetical protein